MPAGVGLAIATGLGATGFAAGAIAVGINAAIFLGLSAASAALAKKGLKQSTAPREIVVRSGSQPKMIVYGETVVGGVLAYMNQRDVGNDDFELWAVVVHAGHEVEALDDIYYEDSLLEGGTDINWSTNQVESGDWYAESGGGVHAAKIWRYLGTSSQAVNADLDSAFADITTAFRLRGYAYTVHRWMLWQGSEEIFKGGEPSNIRAKIQGRIIYDPRLDTSPGANPDNASYFAWSQNPILIATDYARTYWGDDGIDASRFDWDWIADEADLCDEQVVVPPAASPSNYQARYSCNVALSLGDSHDDNIAKILATCLGFRSTNAGLIRFTVGGVTRSATVTLDETDIIGEIVVRTSVPKEERYNRVAGTFYDEAQSYAESEFQPQENATYVTRDNGVTITKQIALEGVTNEYQAQRIAFKHLEQSEDQLSCEVPLRWSGLRLTPGAFVSVTYSKLSWSSKLFRCESVKIGERGIPVTAVLNEDTGNSWADPDVADYTTRDSTGVITKPAEAIPVPTSMTATGMAQAGAAGILVQWVNPSESLTWDYVNVYASATSAWSGASLIASRVTIGQYAHILAEGTTRYYWVRAVRNGVESAREPNSDTSNRTATSSTEPGPGIGKTMAMRINTQADGTSNVGEGSFFGVNPETGAIDYTADGFFLFDGTLYTVPRGETGSPGTFFTGLANRKGFVCYETAGGDPFTVAGVGTNCAFVFRNAAGTAWYYDNNGAPINFTPTSTMVALAWLETSTADLISAGGLLGEPIPLALAAHPSATVGAIMGNNLYLSDGTTPVDDDVTVDAYGDPSSAILWTTYEAGGWSPADTTLSVTVKFFRGATQIASRVINATLTDSGANEGDIALAAGTSTGEATSVSVSNNNTPTPVATVTHTASGKTWPVVASANLPGYSGGPSK